MVVDLERKIIFGLHKPTKKIVRGTKKKGYQSLVLLCIHGNCLFFIVCLVNAFV